MKTPSFVLRPTVGAIALWATACAVSAQQAPAPTLETVTVEASADASAEGLVKGSEINQPKTAR